MTTLTALKAQIATDLRRSDLTTEIAAAITEAINHYQPERFYFNETRSATFVTVADQSRYSSSDDADIPKFVTIDDIFLTDSSSSVHLLGEEDPLELEMLLDASASSGRPYCYSYWDQTFALYPIPDAVYTIRPLGVINKDAPASDGEANNVWMTEAYELIRAAAKVYLGTHTIVNLDLASRARGAEVRALNKLKAETSRKTGTGRIIPTSF